jgi:hypothetical protein
MLISNFGISYPSRSLDPIFLANKTYGDGWYYNNRFHASVLGCMSRTLVCLPKTTPSPRCYTRSNIGKLDNTDPEHRAVRNMLFFSLLPNLEEQLGYLKAEALDAQSLLSGSSSSALTNEQWKAEARQIFESLLARTQITARNIARGVVGQELPGQRDLMRPELQGMCSRYKFRATGWKNISVSRFLCEFIAGLLVCVLGITRENKELWVEEPVRQIAKSRLGRLLASGLIKIGEICPEYGPKALNMLRSIPHLCCSIICAAKRNCRLPRHESLQLPDR